MDADGSNVRRLTVAAAGRTRQGPAWSRDGLRLACASTRDGESLLSAWEIDVMDADGTSIRRLNPRVCLGQLQHAIEERPAVDTHSFPPRAYWCLPNVR